jgi:molecular chaperone DnaK (HSP70)
MNSLVVGADFGTTSSCLSYYNVNTKRVDVIQNEHGSYTSPSILFLDQESSDILCGETVLNLYNDENKCANIFSNIKRLIGYSKNDKDCKELEFFKNNNMIIKEDKIVFNVKFDNQTCEITVKSLLNFYLNYLKSIIKNYFGNQLVDDIIDIVITVPAYFNDNQRTILKECCESINMNVLRIINEPTAASLAYAFEKNKLNKEIDVASEYILTFDSGGGTTDISLLHLDYTDELYEVKNTIGDNFLGGEDITNNITKYIIEKLKLDQSNISKRNYNKIKKEAENAKRNLSFNMNYNIYLELGENVYNTSLSQFQFIEINKDFFLKIRNLIYYVLDDYISKTRDFSYNEIKSVIFVGASTKIPYFKKIFNEILPDAYINDTLNPDQTISIGASIQGALMKDLISSNDGGDILLMDVIPLSIGIETLGGIMTPIISRNNLIPVSRTKEFTNSNSFDDTITINIYQGERKFVKDNVHLGSFDLKCDLFKEFDKGEIQITVEFDVDSNCIINATAYAKVGDVSSSIQVTKDSKVVNKESLDEILYYSEINKLIDSEKSNKILAKIELYDSFKYLLSIFHEKYEHTLDDNIMLNSLNNLFNETFDVIQEYDNYTCGELKIIKEKFEKQWHILLFGGQVILKDSDGLIIEFGGTSIE